MVLVFPQLARLCGMRVFSSRSAKPVPTLSRQQGPRLGPHGRVLGFTLLGKGHVSPRAGDIQVLLQQKGVTAAVPGAPAARSSPACPSVRAPLKAEAALDWEKTSFFRKNTRHKQAKGRVIPGCIKTCVVQHSVTRKLLPRAASPRHSQFHVLTSLQSFSPSFSKRLPGSASARPGSTNPSLRPRQDVRPEGGWVGGGHPLPCAGGGTGPIRPCAPFAAAGRASSSTERHQAMPPTTGLAVLRGEDGHPSSTPSVRGILLAPPNHPDGHRGNSSSAPPLLCASQSQQHHLDFSARKCLL